MTISLVLAVSCFLFCFFLYLFDAPPSSLFSSLRVSRFLFLTSRRGAVRIAHQITAAACCWLEILTRLSMLHLRLSRSRCGNWANALETAYTLRNLLIQRSAALSQAVHWNAGIAYHSILSALHSLNVTFREYSSFSSRSFSYIGQPHVP